jgi:hypothetical protein
MRRELSPAVRRAVTKLFGGRAPEIEARLISAAPFERVHQDILAISFGDEAKLEELCVLAEDDERNIYSMEDRPEEFFVGVPRKDDAAAELARRFEKLGFPVPIRFSNWGQHSKHWKEWATGSCE